jgi:hypothetical protein
MSRILEAESECIRVDLLNGYKSEVGGFDPMEVWLSKMSALVGSWQRILVPHECFVSSFSSKADSLPMWERYGKGGGIAIGFKTASLKETYRLPLAKVQYLKRPFHNGAAEIATIENLKYLMPFLTNGNEIKSNLGARPPDSGGFDDGLHYKILEEAAATKFDEFSYEEEYRLIAARDMHPSPPYHLVVDFRVSGGTLIPYVKLEPVGKVESIEPIVRILVGPGSNASGNAQTLEYFLRTKSRQVPVETSACEIQ